MVETDQTKVLTIPMGSFRWQKEDRLYEILAEIPQYVTLRFQELYAEGRLKDSQNFLLRECIKKGPIPKSDGKGWKQGPITDAYLNSKQCSGQEMNLISFKLQQYYNITEETQRDLAERLSIS